MAGYEEPIELISENFSMLLFLFLDISYYLSSFQMPTSTKEIPKSSFVKYNWF